MDDDQAEELHEDEAEARMLRVLAAAGVHPVDEHGLPCRPRIRAAAVQVFWLLPECVSSWVLWQRLQTQWVRNDWSGRLRGLNYAGVWAVLNGLGVADAQEAFGCIQHMERAVLEVQAEQVSRDG